MTRFLLLSAVILLLAGLVPAFAAPKAATTVTITGPAGEVTKALPAEGGPFDLNLPLAKNSVNKITIKAVDPNGNTATKTVNITQVSLDQVVVAQVTTERLSPEEVQQLVNDGVIDLQDPENYNVSQFTIVITIAGEPVKIDVPVPVPINDPKEADGEAPFPMPDADNAGGAPPPAPNEIIVLLDEIAGPPGAPPVQLPGVLVIEGKIKSLKEFFSVRLVLLNTSGIFTLSNVTANIEVPAGALTPILPATGSVAFGDILPGDGGTPGQAERQFILRGDRIGTHDIKVNFGGVLTGPDIPEDAPIPFNGDAHASVEVKGPPTFQVQVYHPAQVVKDEPYDLQVEITNTGELPALYASLDLDVGADGKLVRCTTDPGTNEPSCQEVESPETRPLGHIWPGKKVRETFTVRPGTSGIVASCVGVSDQNITLQVYAGTGGCLTGHYPPASGANNGQPTVSVLPLPNALGVGIANPVTAFFSTEMNESSITTGDGGSFRVYDKARQLVPGALRFTQTFGRTVAIWQFKDDITNRLAPNSEYTVVIDPTVTDKSGNRLAASWTSTFTTTGDAFDDVTPPTLSLTVEPPVDPNHILPGQVALVQAYASDQGSGVMRVEARLKDMDNPEAQYELIDQKSVYQGDQPPFLFAIDSAKLTPGRQYRLLVTAYDGMANGQDATLSLILAITAAPPTITLPADPATPQLQGITIDLTPRAVSDTAKEVRFFLDSAVEPFKIVTLAPFQSSIGTMELPLGSHSVKAIVSDGLGQTGDDSFTFQLAENKNMPVVDFGSAVDGAQYLSGDRLTITGHAQDAVGIQRVAFYLDAPSGNPIAEGSAPFQVDTTDLSAGGHKIYQIATNRLGISNDTADPASALDFSVIRPVEGPPPPAPTVDSITPPENGLVTITGATSAGARVDITNLRTNLAIAVNADGAGRFSAQIDGQAGDQIQLIVHDYNQSRDPSAPANATVPAPPVLQRIEVLPASLNFDRFDQWADLTVMAYYDTGSPKNVTGQAGFSSDKPSIASVNSGGRVAPHANGQATIAATFGGLTAGVPVNVGVVVLESITVDPSQIIFSAHGQTQRLTVTGRYSDGSSSELATGNSFSTADARVATVDVLGVVTAVRRGETIVSVSRIGVAPVNVPVTVDIAGDTLPTATIVSPANNSEVERGDLVSVSVKADDEVGGVAKIFLNVTGQTTYSEMRQISPPSLETVQVFNFNVADTAAVGGTIDVAAHSQDTGLQNSDVAHITLKVVDKTAPFVTIDQPAPEAVFAYGDTVTVKITATDKVGVKKIRYTTTGGMNKSGEQTFDPPVSPATATFTFDIPNGLPDPNIFIHGFASDAMGNEGESAQVHITAAQDVTPPATEATAVTDPGTTATTTVSYRVTDGMSDLHHVELFFRKDGHGTFNRYTDSDGGNPQGLYNPTAGGTGTIVFNSTKMGGDGHYEFYTVGVDKTGNREPAPKDAENRVVPDQQTTFAAGTVWTEIKVPTLLGPSDTTFDNQNVRVIGTTLTLEGHHTFQNLELVNSAVLTHPETTSDREYYLDLAAWSVLVDGTSRINLDGRGYLGGNQPGNDCTGRTLSNQPGSVYRSGGSYGGPGGVYDGPGASPTYGLITEAADLGSGGSCGGYSYRGGDGGGRMLLAAINVVVDGKISADGNTGTGYQAGSGSGGGLRLSISTLSGAGTITANGGGYEVGGGGGRIAVHFTDLSTFDTSSFRALGGQGGNRVGGNGTVCLKDINQGNGTLVVDGQNNPVTWTPLAIPPGYIFDNIVLQNGARIYSDDPVVVSNTLELTNNSILTHSLASEKGLVIEAKRVKIDTTSKIDVSARGYKGGNRDGNSNCTAQTLGFRSGAVYRSGGTYGGRGGVFEGSGSNLSYGHPAQPIYLGSGGSCGGYSYVGGHGGGLVKIHATDSVLINGSILADGGTGTGYQAGSGSGGSILIETSLLEGTGHISAAGGGYEVGGGGGRIAITYDYLGPFGGDLNGTRNITALGGKGGNRWGSAGTVVLKHPGQTYGNLILDDVVEGASAQNWIELTSIGFGKITALTDDTLTTDGTTPYTINGLVGLTIKPNILKAETFKIIANTANTITVDLSGGYRLVDVAQVGDTYTGFYQFDNVFFRRGAKLLLGDQLKVEDTLQVDEYGILSHYNVGLDFYPRLEIDADKVIVTATSRIDLTDRGYLGGNRGGNDCSGQSTGNSSGAEYRAGGSHAGIGGVFEGPGKNAIYGNQTDPADFGAGGSCGGYNYRGGNGGGWVKLRTRLLQLDGLLAADGGTGTGYQSGSGAGGSINIVASDISGGGTISASGGSFEVGGGGGRIAITYDTLHLNTNQIRAVGGAGGNVIGGHGTIWLKQTTQAMGDLVIDGQGIETPEDSSPIPEGATYDNLILRNKARVIAQHPLEIRGNLNLENDSRLAHPTNSEAGLTIVAENITIDPSSKIDTSARGYRGGNRLGNDCTGETLGRLPGPAYRAGGSYGGYGGVFEGPGSNPLYGDPTDPRSLGTGGSCGGYSYGGGMGGGLVQMTVHNKLLVNGAIRADGQNGSGYQSGSGSGGSIKIDTKLLEGIGSITANGGGYEVGGGGGRIAIYYSALGATGNDLNGLRNVTAFGPTGGNRNSSAGTIYLHRTGQTNGDLVFDAGRSSTSGEWTALPRLGFGTITNLTADTLTTDGKVTLLPNGLVGQTINPNLKQSHLFKIISNTANTLTVDIHDGTALIDVAQVGDSFAAVHRYDNLTLRGGAFLAADSLFQVDEVLELSEKAVITHFDAGSNYYPRVDIHAHSLIVPVDCQINVDGRGYPGGNSNGNGECTAQTVGHTAGSIYRSGGSYGGLGGRFDGTPNPVYGSFENPDDLGSGGSCGGYSHRGGNGGGLIHIIADTVNLDGSISSTGWNGTGYQSGSGSGGTIWIEASTLSGSGSITAAGGGYEVGGGGGRVAVRYRTLGIPADRITAPRGVGGNASGETGTVHLEPMP